MPTKLFTNPDGSPIKTFAELRAYVNALSDHYRTAENGKYYESFRNGRSDAEVIEGCAHLAPLFSRLLDYSRMNEENRRELRELFNGKLPPKGRITVEAVYNKLFSINDVLDRIKREHPGDLDRLVEATVNQVREQYTKLETVAQKPLSEKNAEILKARAEKNDTERRNEEAKRKEYDMAVKLDRVEMIPQDRRPNFTRGERIVRAFNYGTVTEHNFQDTITAIQKTVDHDKKSLRRYHMSKNEIKSLKFIRDHRNNRLDVVREQDENKYAARLGANPDFETVAAIPNLLERNIGKLDGDLNKLTEKAEALHSIYHAHKNRSFFSMLAHPILYYRESQLIKRYRGDLTAAGLSKTTVDDLLVPRCFDDVKARHELHEVLPGDYVPDKHDEPLEQERFQDGIADQMNDAEKDKEKARENVIEEVQEELENENEKVLGDN